MVLLRPSVTCVTGVNRLEAMMPRKPGSFGTGIPTAFQFLSSPALLGAGKLSGPRLTLVKSARAGRTSLPLTVHRETTLLEVIKASGYSPSPAGAVEGQR